MKKFPTRHLVATLCGLATILAAGSAIAQDSAAAATLANSQGREVGTVSFTEGSNGLLLQADLHDLPAGTHGFHLHAVGACTPPDFKAAGGHFNPTEKKHGFLAKEGPHLGDMPNIHVPASGTLAFEFFLPEVTIDKEAQLMDKDGTAVMIHSKADDYKTDPAGEAGDRIACGVIEKK